MRLNRETWLQGVLHRTRPYFKSHGTPLPGNIDVSVGWCNTSPESLAGGLYPPGEEMPNWEIFINPDVLSGELAVCVLLHELIHIAVAPYMGHRGKFREIATAFGFGSKLVYADVRHGPPATFLEHLTEGLGPYPHRRKHGRGHAVGSSHRRGPAG